MLARRLAPCSPVQATSPTARRRSTVVRPHVVGGDSAATVVRRGNDGDRLARHVDPALHADGVDAGKTLAKLVGGLVRDVEIDAGLARFEHGLVNGARGDVARSERTGGMKLLHEFLAVAIDEAAAFAAHRLRNQEAAVRGQQRGGMELDVLQIDAARAGAIGHGDAVAARARRIRRVQKDAAEAAGRQNGFLGENGEDFSRGLVEHVRADAGQRAVNVGGLDRVVRRRQQVHRGRVRRSLSLSGETCTRSKKARSIENPVRSLKWMMRGMEWPASDVRSSSPGCSGEGSKGTCSSSIRISFTRRGPSWLSSEAASGELSPAPAERMSATSCSGDSSCPR